jgi:hypothetical protein
MISYDVATLNEIERLVGQCRHDPHEAIESIVRAARDYQICPELATSRKERDQLLALGAALEKAGAAYYSLDVGAEVRLTMAAMKRGIELVDCDYLTELAKVVLASVEGMPARKETARHALIRTLAGIVRHFTEWEPSITYDQHYGVAPYGGRFFDLVTVCLQPIEPPEERSTNQALGKAIQRVLSEPWTD